MPDTKASANSASDDNNGGGTGSVVAHRRLPPWPLAAVWIATLVVFLPALQGDYVDDDLDLVLHSPAFAGLDHLWEAVRAPFWGTDCSFWRPAASAVMCIGHALGDGPWPGHVVALSAHLVATTLTFAILRQLAVDVPRAALAAAVFALHPCQVESVAWVAAVADPLVGAATLLSLWAWLRWRARARRGMPWLSWFAFALALASKEGGVCALGWIAAFELATGHEPRRRCVGAALGFALLLAAWFLARALVFGDLAAGFDRGRLVDVGLRGERGLLTRAYLGAAMTALPTGWLGCTPYRWVPPDSEGLLRALGPVALIVVAWIACVASAARGRRDLAAFATLGFVASVALPVLLAPNVGPWPLADRYVYLGTFAVAVVWIACARCRPLLALALAGVCAAASTSLVPQWRSQEAVVARALADCPQHPEPHYLLAQRECVRAERLCGAHHQESRRMHHEHAWRAFVRVRHLLQRPVYAAADLHAVLGLNAELGAAVAALDARLRPPCQVARELRELAAKRPDSAPVQIVLGAAYATAGDYHQAARAWQRALELDPTSREATFNLARLRAMSRRETDAGDEALPIVHRSPR